MRRPLPVACPLRTCTLQPRANSLASFIELIRRRPKFAKDTVRDCQRDFSLPGEHLGRSCLAEQLGLTDVISSSNYVNAGIDLAGGPYCLGGGSRARCTHDQAGSP